MPQEEMLALWIGWRPRGWEKLEQFGLYKSHEQHGRAGCGVEGRRNQGQHLDFPLCFFWLEQLGAIYSNGKD